MKRLIFVALIVLCLVFLRQGLKTSHPSPWEQVGEKIVFSTSTGAHTMSPNGKIAAWISEGENCVDCKQDIVLHDVLTGREQRITPPSSPETEMVYWRDVHSIRFSPDSTLLAANICLGRQVFRIDLYDTKTYKRVSEWQYQMHDSALRRAYITDFVGNRVEVSDPLFDGIYTLQDGELVSFVERKADSTKEEVQDQVGGLRVWAESESKKGILSFLGPSVVSISAGAGEPLSFKPGSAVADLKILPAGDTFLSLEIGGAKHPADGLTTVEDGGAVYCRSSKDGKILYKLVDVGGLWGFIALSDDGNALMLADWSMMGAGMTVRFFRR